MTQYTYTVTAHTASQINLNELSKNSINKMDVNTLCSLFSACYRNKPAQATGGVFFCKITRQDPFGKMTHFGFKAEILGKHTTSIQNDTLQDLPPQGFLAPDQYTLKSTEGDFLKIEALMGKQ